MPHFNESAFNSAIIQRRMKSKDQRKKLIERLTQMAIKAGAARDKFQTALADAKERPDWKTACEENGIVPESTEGDWMS
jgi:hypothetical protein